MEIAKCGKCGWPPAIFRLISEDRVSFEVGCFNPDCGKKTEEQLRDEAIQKWNRRQRI